MSIVCTILNLFKGFFWNFLTAGYTQIYHAQTALVVIYIAFFNIFPASHKISFEFAIWRI